MQQNPKEGRIIVERQKIPKCRRVKGQIFYDWEAWGKICAILESFLYKFDVKHKVRRSEVFVHDYNGRASEYVLPKDKRRPFPDYVLGKGPDITGVLRLLTPEMDRDLAISLQHFNKQKKKQRRQCHSMKVLFRGFCNCAGSTFSTIPMN